MLSARQTLAALVLCGSLLSAGPVRADAEHVVMVLPPKTSGVSAGDAKFLLGLLTGAITRRSGYDVTDAKKTEDAVEIHSDINPVCLKDPTCAAAIADELHADLFVQASFAKTGGKFLLQSWLYRSDKSSLVAKHAESMEEVGSMKANAEICVRELLHAFETGARPPSETSAAPPPPPKPAPPPQEEEEAPKRPARKPLVAAPNAPAEMDENAPIVPDLPPKKPKKPAPPPPEDEAEYTPPPKKVKKPAPPPPEDEAEEAPPPRPAPRPAPPPAPVAAKPPPKPVAKAPAKPDNRMRVLVLDAESSKGLGKDADKLTEMVVDQLTAHKGIVVIGDDETQKAEKLRLKKDPKCLHEKPCQHALGKDLNAEVFVSMKLSKVKQKYSVDMSLSIVGDSTGTIHHTETMHSLKNLKINAELCVKALFK